MADAIPVGTASYARPPRTPRPVMWKVVTMIGLILFLLIPLGMISMTIRDRQGTRDGVISEIAQTWASEQTMVGPVLAIPYLQMTETKDEKGHTKLELMRSTAYLLPRQFDAQGTLKPEKRYRGIYQSIVYTTGLDAKGTFDLATLQELKIPPDRILWDEASVVVGISDPKGIVRRPELTWQGHQLELLPGNNGISFLKAGLYAPIALNPDQKIVPYHLNLLFRGSQSLSVAPVGKQNVIRLQSTWTSPSFIGNTLPSNRRVDAKGFSATWEIPYFARNYGQAFLASSDTETLINTSTVGAQLLTPVDSYRQSERAVKYGILFLVLTFATFFLFEMVSQSRLHPFQYLLIGCAISLFYLLLIAFSEVVRFAVAYGISGGAVVLVVTLYSRAILGRIKRYAEWMIAGLLTVLYGYLYVLLQLEDLSLLFGAIGLFLVLAIIMYVTRNIDWYTEQPS